MRMHGKLGFVPLYAVISLHLIALVDRTALLSLTPRLPRKCKQRQKELFLTKFYGLRNRKYWNVSGYYRGYSNYGSRCNLGVELSTSQLTESPANQMLRKFKTISPVYFSKCLGRQAR